MVQTPTNLVTNDLELGFPQPHTRSRSFPRHTLTSRLILLFHRFFHRKSFVPFALISLLLILLFLISGLSALSTWERDLGYIFRPIWDRPEPPWRHITQFPPPSGLDSLQTRTDYCGLHGWSARPTRETNELRIIDAVLVSSELDMLEIRMKEYQPFVSAFIVVESNVTFAGQPKPTYFADHRSRFDFIPSDQLIYLRVDGLASNLPVGSFENEAETRGRIGQLLRDLTAIAKIRPGDMVIQSDVDEIISRQTLELLRTCRPSIFPLHLNVDNYRYSYEFPLNNGGYFRPKVVEYTGNEGLEYTHGRQGDHLLGGSGWHCSFCFKTFGEIKAKMLGYSHNDRVKDKKLVGMDRLRRNVCEGKDPFEMYPEAFTFKDLISQSGKTPKSHSFSDVPVALKEDPGRYRYLLDRGCDRSE